MHFSLVKLNPVPENPSCFDDAILPLYFALKKLGFEVETRVNSLHPTAKNILFGANQYARLPLEDIPRNSILFNLEQLSSGDTWFTPRYVEMLRLFPVWDYSARNCAGLASRFGVTATHVPLGYVEEMTRLAQNRHPLYDVLFYGALNERRRTVIEALHKTGARVFLPAGMLAGVERDQLIVQSALVLNVHYYLPASLEVVRLGYLWANKRAVVSEREEHTEIPSGLETACAYAAHEDLVFAAHKLIRDKSARERQAKEGFRAFTALPQSEILKKIVGARKQPAMAPAPPDRLNVGSGRAFRPEAVNLDIAAYCNPDILLDISQPLHFEQVYATRRFGDISLKRESFSWVGAFEVLEHVSDLPQTMRNILDLLSDGGVLELSVPYALSLGADQDPTHVRHFNEHSWFYYTWCSWRLGWRNERFDLITQEFVLSDLGKALQKQGASQEALLRTPRAVDGMQVRLRKRKTTEMEKLEYDREFRTFYLEPAMDWEVRHERA